MSNQTQTLNSIQAIINDISFKNERFVVLEKGDGFLLQLRYDEPDVDTGRMTEQHGRKWYISQYATDSEIIRTALKACITSAEHRVREHFYYRNQRVFGPHIDIHKLLSSSPSLWQDGRSDTHE